MSDYGYVYILSNPLMDIYKVGRSKYPKKRAKDLSKEMGVPEPFELEYYEKFINYKLGEKLVHRRLKEHRVNKKREFFKADKEYIIKVIKECKKEVEKREKAGYIYILSNPEFDYYVVGKSKNPKREASELSGGTGVPFPYEVEYKAYFEDSVSAIKYIKEKLKYAQKNEKFYDIELSKIKTIIENYENYDPSREANESNNEKKKNLDWDKLYRKDTNKKNQKNSDYWSNFVHSNKKYTLKKIGYFIFFSLIIIFIIIGTNSEEPHEVLFQGVIIGNGVNFRNGPGTDHDIIDDQKFYAGTKLKVIDSTNDNNWYKVIDNDNKGWIYGEYLVNINKYEKNKKSTDIDNEKKDKENSKSQTETENDKMISENFINEENKKVLEEKERNNENYFEKGKVLFSDKKYNEAIKNFQKDIELNPKKSQSYIYLGNIYKRIGDYKEAIKIYNNLIELDLKQYEAHYNLGLIYNQQNNYQKSIYHFEKALNLSGNKDIVNYNLGIAYYKAGQIDNAKKQYNILKNNDSNLEKSLNKMFKN